jgi:hypothetical protein
MKCIVYRQHRSSPRRGAHTLEFALVLPLALLLFFASIEFGRLTLLKHLVDNASYEAARHVMVPGASVSEAEAKVNSILSVVGIKNAKIVVEPSEILESTDSVKVCVSIPAENNLWMVSKFSKGVNLSSETEMMTERGPLQQAEAVTIPPPPPPPPPHPRRIHPRRIRPRRIHLRRIHLRRIHPRRIHPRRIHPRRIHPRRIRLRTIRLRRIRLRTIHPRRIHLRTIRPRRIRPHVDCKQY